MAAGSDDEHREGANEMSQEMKKSHRKQLPTVVMLTVIAACLMFLTASCGKNIEKQIAENLALGQKYLLEMKYEEAIIAFQKAIQLDPKCISAYTGLVQVYEKNDQTRERDGIIQSGSQVIKDQGDQAGEEAELFLKTAAMSLCNQDYQDIDQELLKDILEEYYSISGRLDLEERVQVHMEQVTNYVLNNEEPQDIEIWKEMYRNGDYSALFQAANDAEWIYQMAENHEGKSCYFGETEGYLPHGFGFVIYGKGEKERSIFYVGQWKHGLRTGRGMALWEQDSIKGYYIGEWDEDIQHGEAAEYSMVSDEYGYQCIGYAEHGVAEGTYQSLYIDGAGNIAGYEFTCKDGIPQSYGVHEVHEGLYEETMALMIQNGEREPVWHTWAGLSCVECGERNGLELLNAFDHSWSGWGENPETYTFLGAD